MGKVIMSGIVPLLTKPSVDIILAKNIAVGSSVYLNEDGNYVEYIVVDQGISSDGDDLYGYSYDSSCNGTWLLRKDIHSYRQWNTSDVYIYETSTINTWLNGDFFNGLGNVEQATIKQVKIPYNKDDGTFQSGANGLPCKIFLLDPEEVGWVYGDTLDYFKPGGTGTSANNKRIANYNGTASYWWLRSPYAGDSTTNVFAVRAEGDCNYYGASSSYGVRPALILPFNAEFNKTNMRLIGVGGSEIGDQQISDYPEGGIIKINENGIPVEFYIAKHNYEPTLNGTERTLVVRQDVYNNQTWDSSQGQEYSNSTIDAWLNNTYKALFGSETQTLIGTTVFFSAGSALTRPIFLLSLTELGGTGYVNTPEGSKLDISNILQIAHMNGNTIEQWTRSPTTAETGRAYAFVSNGSITTARTDLTSGARPCFTLPASTKVDSNGLIVT